MRKEREIGKKAVNSGHYVVPARPLLIDAVWHTDELLWNILKRYFQDNSFQNFAKNWGGDEQTTCGIW